MCRLCELWGVKHKDYPARYFFNDELYDPDLLFEDLKWASQVACWAATFENQRADLAAYENALTTHRHQIMTLREILDTIEFVDDIMKKGKIPGGEFAVSVCGCKYLTLNVKEFICMTWEPIPLEEIGWFVNEDVNLFLKRISYEEARDILINCDKKGYLHSFDIMKGEGEDMPWLPWVCNCEYPSCHSCKARIDLGYLQDEHRGHYVAVPDTGKCNGCRKCAPWCQWGALHVASATNKVTISPLRCMGCGLCQTHCPESDWKTNSGAIRMVDRDGVLVSPRQVYL